MSPRDTRTGGVLEQMVLPALDRGGYQHESSVRIGARPGGGRHVLDVLAWKDRRYEILVSLKWQQTGGTAEQKIPFEVISLIEAVQEKPGRKAYLVLGGNGWTLRDYYLSGALKKHLKDADLVEIVDMEAFVSKANKGAL